MSKTNKDITDNIFYKMGMVLGIILCIVLLLVGLVKADTAALISSIVLASGIAVIIGGLQFDKGEES
ncbi:MAG: hypothetical protein J6U54_06745 [Clostridiales bacterium]|nr:hypothetical protein [Clostridiales bacterium]